MVKALLGALLVSVLTMSAFGLGISVGARAPREPATIVARPDVPAGGYVSLPTPQGTIPAPQAVPTAPIDEDLFRQAWDLLQKQYYGDVPQQREATYAAIRGLIAALGDPHTAFLDPDSAEVFNSDIEGHFEGIGARVDLAPGGGVRITYLFPGQPADQAGLQVGDVVMAVDSRSLTGMSLMEAIGLIRGPEGTSATLTIARDGQAPQEITVVRARVEIPVVESRTLDNGRIVYIALSEFSSVAPARLADALRQAMAQRPGGLILDLRGNPGGLLDAAVRIGSYFVPSGSILIERLKDGSEQVYQREGRYLLGDTPLVVLVDSGSASASEIVAGAIQDAGTGILMGDQTYGKGSVQLPNTLSDGSQLRITIARWFTPQNRAIDKVGLTPDYVVSISKADLEAGRDPQLDAAVKYLQGDQGQLMTPTPPTVPASPRGTLAPTSATPGSTPSPD